MHRYLRNLYCSVHHDHSQMIQSWFFISQHSLERYNLSFPFIQWTQKINHSPIYHRIYNVCHWFILYIAQKSWVISQISIILLGGLLFWVIPEKGFSKTSLQEMGMFSLLMLLGWPIKNTYLHFKMNLSKPYEISDSLRISRTPDVSSWGKSSLRSLIIKALREGVRRSRDKWTQVNKRTSAEGGD